MRIAPKALLKAAQATLLLVAAGTANAVTTITVADVNVASGATQAIVAVNFATDRTDVFGYQFTVNFVRTPPGGAVVTSGVVPGTGGTGQCGGAADAEQQPTATFINGGDFSTDEFALGSALTCNLTFPLDPTAPVGTYELTVTGYSFNDVNGGTITPGMGDVAIDGSINIQAGSTPPTLAFGTVTQPPGGGAGTAAGSVAVNVTDGGSTTTGAASTTLTCSLPAGSNAFSITSNATKTTNAVADSGDNYTIGVQCTRGASAGSSTLTCVQSTSPSVVRPDLTQEINCPQAGLTAPTVAYNPAPPGPINYTGAAGATVNRSVTVTQTAAGNVGATTTVQNCQVSAGFTLNGFSNIVFTGGQANAGGSISTSCTVPAFGQADITGTLTCDEFKQQGASGDSTVQRLWNLNCPAAEPNFSSSPAPGGDVNLTGAPGTQVAGSIVVTNNGTAPLDFDCGTATGFVITNGDATDLAPNTSQTIGVSCTTSDTPGASFGAQLSCTTDDPDFANGVTFDLTCTSLVLSIPTMSAAGKTLLAALLMGLGLLGFSLRRRQTA